MPSVPLQVGPQVEPAPAPLHATRAPWGEPVTALQVPTEPVTSHAWHWPLQPVSQQSPSTQKPEPHSAAEAHATPFGFAHLPSEPATLQRVPPPQTDDPQHTPSTQFPDAHEAAPPAVQMVPLVSLGAHTPPLQ